MLAMLLGLFVGLNQEEVYFGELVQSKEGWTLVQVDQTRDVIPYSVWRRDAQVQPYGKKPLKRTPSRSLRIQLGEHSVASLTQTSRGWRGLWLKNKEMFALIGDGPHIVARKTDSHRDWQCNIQYAPSPKVIKNATKQSQDGLALIDLALETDWELLEAFESEANLIEGIELLVASTSLIYERDFSARLRIAHLGIATSEDDPWQAGGIGELQDFYRKPQNGRRLLHRTLAHILSPHGGYGVGFIESLCNTDWGYGRSFNRALFYNFPEFTAEIHLFAHELGHQFGSYHTHDYEPAIDHCPSPTGDLPEGGGTIMSYCQYQPNGIEVEAFHSRVIERVKGVLANQTCIQWSEQALSFPDDILSTVLISNYDTNQDGSLQPGEAGAITSLDVSQMGITSLDDIEHLVYLTSLLATENQISQLPTKLPQSLKVLDISQNPLLADNCKWLADYEAFNFDSFIFQPTIDEWACKNQPILFTDPKLKSELVAAFDSNSDGEIDLKEAATVQRINVSKKNITSLDGLQYFHALSSLEATENQLTQITSLPSSLIYLNLNENQLTEVDFLAQCPNLESIHIAENQIQALPNLQHLQQLFDFFASHNQISEFPQFREPFGAGVLDLSDNQISEIPIFPKFISYLDIRGNLLESLPPLRRNDYGPNGFFFFQQNNLGPGACQTLADLYQWGVPLIETYPQNDGNDVDCPLNATAPVTQVVPWLVNNEVFQSSVEMVNSGFEDFPVLLEAKTREGQSLTKRIVIPEQASQVYSSEAMFPGLSGYALYVRGYTNKIHTFTSLDRPQGGKPSHAFSQGHAIKNLPNKLLFANLSNHQAIAVTAPETEENILVNMKVFADAEGEIYSGQLEIGPHPSVMLLSQLGIDSDGKVLTIEMLAPTGKSLAGTSFSFGIAFDPTVIRAESTFYDPYIPRFPKIDNQYQPVLKLFNGYIDDVDLILLASDYQGNSAQQEINIPRQEHLVIDLAEVFSEMGPYQLEVCCGSQVFAQVEQTVALQGRPAPRMLREIGYTEFGRSLIFPSFRTALPELTLTGNWTSEDTIILQLRNQQGHWIAEHTIENPEPSKGIWQLHELFPQHNLAGLCLRIFTNHDITGIVEETTEGGTTWNQPIVK